MVTSQSPSPSPAGRPDQDDRPSTKLGVAVSMLRRGHSPLDVANATGVPLALVDLIAAEHHPDPPGRPEPSPSTGATSSMPDEPGSALDDDPVRDDRVRPEVSVHHTALDTPRWAARICCAAVLVLVGNVGLAAAADIMHSSTLAMAAVILTPLLLTALGLCAIACTYAGRGGSPPPR